VRSRRLGGAALALLAALVLDACAARGGASRPGSPRAAPAPTLSPAVRGARELERAGDLEGALAAYAVARDSAPEDVRAHLGYVGLMLRLGRRSVAHEEYVARAAAPSAPPVEGVMARRLAGDQSSSALRSLYREAAQREPDVAWWPLAVAEVELAEASAWTDRRAQAREQGDRHAETKAYEQARGALARAAAAAERAARRPAPPVEADVYRGHVAALEGDLLGGAEREAAYRAAAAHFERASERAPASVDAWAGLGDLRGRLDEPGPSLTAWARAARLAPSDAYVRLEVARRLHDIGRRREAVEEYRAVALLRPRDADPWLRMGDAHAEDERWEAAAAAFREALARDPAAIEGHARLAGVLEQQGRPGEARESWQRYIDQGGERREEAARRIEALVTGTR
jgi:tetratricopeptide (TPR) repeat protein